MGTRYQYVQTVDFEANMSTTMGCILTAQATHVRASIRKFQQHMHITSKWSPPQHVICRKCAQLMPVIFRSHSMFMVGWQCFPEGPVYPLHERGAHIFNIRRGCTQNIPNFCAANLLSGNMVLTSLRENNMANYDFSNSNIINTRKWTWS